MLPRADRSHDQLLSILRATIVAAIGGLVIGHVLWLVGIKFATDSQHVNTWVLVVAAVSFVVGVVGGLLGLKYRRVRATAKAAFLWCLPISPVLFSLSVLGVTYL
jgi:cytochrome bd-type quinol oxidase subunit 2